VLAFVLLTPHVVFGYYDLVQYSLLTSVFGDDDVAADTTTTTAPATTSGSVTASGGVTTTVAPAVAPPTVPPWEGEERLNILLLGGDFGEGRTGIRTDTMITVSIDPATGDVAMFSVPRNWTQAALPAGMGIWDCNCYPELINELWIAGEQYPDAFPGPGSPSENAVKAVISEFLGIPIHYYAMVNLDGFVDVVDSLGGVDIYIPEKVIDEDYPHEDGSVERIEIDAGLQHLNGHLALAYARTRHQDSDYFRMNRQRCVIEAVMEQTDPTDLLLNFGSLADVIKQSVTTDIPLDALPGLVELLPDIDRDAIVSVRFIPPEYHLKYRDDGKPGRIANTDLVQEHVQLVIEDPERAVVELGLENLDDVCGEPQA
jgi:LCP family protein required for cell wall assembly